MGHAKAPNRDPHPHRNATVAGSAAEPYSCGLPGRLIRLVRSAVQTNEHAVFDMIIRRWMLAPLLQLVECSCGTAATVSSCQPYLKIFRTS